MKNDRFFFYLKTFFFFVVKFSIYLNRRVFVIEVKGGLMSYIAYFVN